MEMEYQVICRSCLTTSASEYINMATPTSEGILLLEYFNFCTSLKATTTDNLPVTICTVCCHDLQIAFEFIQSSRQADTILHQNLIANPIQEQQEVTQDVEQNVLVEDIIVETEEAECENNLIENFIQVKRQENSEVIESETAFDNEVVHIQENNDEYFNNSECTSSDVNNTGDEPETNSEDNYLRMKIFSKLQLSENDGYLAKFVEECVRKTALENAKRKQKEENARNKDLIQLVYPDGKCPPRPGIKWKCRLCGRMSKELSVYESHVNWHKGCLFISLFIKKFLKLFILKERSHINVTFAAVNLGVK